jgi:two-component system response regulator FixJ
VYVIDDDDAVRDSLLFLLDVDGLRGRGFASAEAFLAAPKAASGCIVTDLRMPGMEGTDLLRLLPWQGVHLPVILITGHGDLAAAARAVAAGAFDVIEKPFQDNAILGAVRAALSLGKPDTARDARASETAARIGRLAEQERRVLCSLVQGDANAQVAAAHGLALGDVALLRARIMRSVGAATPSELVRLVTEARRYAARAGGSL